MEEKVNIREKLNEGYVRAILIVEVLGRPAEHVGSVLKGVADAIQKDKKIIFLNRKLYRPKKVKEAKDLFTSFMEIEVLAEGLVKLFDMCFDYMPSSIEIVEPTEVKFNLTQANSIINDLASRLHKYDAVAKELKIEKQILQDKLNELLKGNPIIETEDVKVEIGKKEEAKESPEQKKDRAD